MLSSSVYPLANPKGVKLLCELCKKTAHYMCTQCRVTYYCDLEHQKADWIGIHEKICQLLIPLRTSMPFFSSEKERWHSQQQIVQRQKHMIDLTRTVAQKLLFEGKPDEAIPGALQSLRFATSVYGTTSSELVPSYLLLAEASIGLGQLRDAEEYLSQAQWTVMKTSECITGVEYKLYRNLGLLYSARGNYEKALWYLADDIYHASEVFGTEDIHTAGGYFHMANVFFGQGKMDVADSMYTEVVDIWHKHLSELVVGEMEKPKWKRMNAALEDPDPDFQDDEETLDVAQQAEAVQVLNAINNIRDQGFVPKHGRIGKVSHALAMLYYVIMDYRKAIDYGSQALEESKMLLNNDKEIESIEKLLEMAHSALGYPGGQGPSPTAWVAIC